MCPPRPRSDGLSEIHLDVQQGAERERCKGEGQICGDLHSG